MVVVSWRLPPGSCHSPLPRASDPVRLLWSVHSRYHLGGYPLPLPPRRGGTGCLWDDTALHVYTHRSEGYRGRARLPAIRHVAGIEEAFSAWLLEREARRDALLGQLWDSVSLVAACVMPLSRPPSLTCSRPGCSRRQWRRLAFRRRTSFFTIPYPLLGLSEFMIGEREASLLEPLLLLLALRTWVRPSSRGRNRGRGLRLLLVLKGANRRRKQPGPPF